jgi:hypothetical protein
MNEIFMTISAGAIACIALIVVTAMRLSQLGDHLVRQEAELKLILKQLDIACPPPPSPAIQAIATRRVAAVKAYRQETGSLEASTRNHRSMAGQVVSRPAVAFV